MDYQSTGAAPKQRSKKEIEAILQEAKERFRHCEEAEKQIRIDALEDARFRAGEQWPEAIRLQREQDQRPCLTINRLPQFLRQVTNEQRQNRPSIQVNPVDDNGDPDTAEVLQGLIRHIEQRSNADIAYDTAFDGAACGGFGYIRVITEHCDPMSFDQEISIKRVRNPFTVYFDPACQEPDYSDGRYAFVVEDFSVDDYKREFPDSELAGLEDFSSIGDGTAQWLDNNSIRVVEYFRITTERRTLVLLANGSVLLKENAPPGVPILRQRETEIQHCEWFKLNAAEILEENIFPSQWIPIVPVLGDEIDLDGERRLMGLVRHARDPQRMYNYWASAETETIALAPRAPFIGAMGQFEGQEGKWKTANIRNQAYLEYVPKSVNGTLVGPPQRQVYEPPIQAISQARLQAADDLKATTGIYDASLGARGNETSGKAILARQREGDTANFHLSDNLARSMRHLGRIIIDLIPKIYDTPRVLRIIGEDQETDQVKVNQPTLVKGVEKIYDLTTGKYDVTVSVGPSYTTKRQEAVESMLGLAATFPPLVQIAGDLLVKNMDWPGAQEISERMKKMLPPQLQESDEQQQIPPQAQKQIAELSQLSQALTEQLNVTTEEINQKRFEIDSKERIEKMRLEFAREELKAKTDLELSKLGQQAGLAMLQEDLANLRQKIDMQSSQSAQLQQMSHERQMASEAQAGQKEMAQLQQLGQQQQQQSQQGHEMQMAQQSQGHDREMATQQQGHDKQMATMQRERPALEEFEEAA